MAATGSLPLGAAVFHPFAQTCKRPMIYPVAFSGIL